MNASPLFFVGTSRTGTATFGCRMALLCAFDSFPYKISRTDYTNGIMSENQRPQYFLSRLRYCSASAMWRESSRALSSRSAMVRATFRMRS